MERRSKIVSESLGSLESGEGTKILSFQLSNAVNLSALLLFLRRNSPSLPLPACGAFTDIILKY